MTATLPGELIYRVILDYEALHEMFRDRVEDLNTSRISIDEAGKFTPGYAAKLLSNPPMRMLSRESLGKMLDATGMVLVAVVDDARFAAIKGRLVQRKRRDKQKSPTNVGQTRPTWLFTPKKASKMRAKWWASLTDAQRKKHQRKAQKGQAASRRRKRRERTAISAAKPASQPSQLPQNAPTKRLSRAPTPQPFDATGQNDLRSPRP